MFLRIDKKNYPYYPCFPSIFARFLTLASNKKKKKKEARIFSEFLHRKQLLTVEIVLTLAQDETANQR